VLALVVADRDLGRLVEQDVPGHQDRVRQEPDTVARLARRLLLELRHTTEFAVGGDAFENPVHLGVVRTSLCKKIVHTSGSSPAARYVAMRSND